MITKVATRIKVIVNSTECTIMIIMKIMIVVTIVPAIQTTKTITYKELKEEKNTHG